MLWQTLRVVKAQRGWWAGPKIEAKARASARRRTPVLTVGGSGKATRVEGVSSLCSYFRSALLQFLPLRFYRNHAFGVAPIVLLQ